MRKSKEGRKVARGTISKRLGIPTASRLTKAIIKEKIQILEKGLEDDRYKGDLHRYAVYYKNWYRFRLKRKAA